MNDVRKKWILTAILAVIEILMTVTGLGYFVIGSSAFTVLHIPVFIAVILAGLPQGFLIAGIFGLSSMINAYVFNDSLLGYLFQDPRISVVPRLMIPFAVWLAYKVICYIADDHTLSARLICSGFAAVDGVIANAVFVIFSIAILDPEAIGITDSLSTSTIVVTNIIAINIFCEIIAAVAVTSLTVLILHRIGWLGLVAAMSSRSSFRADSCSDTKEMTSSCIVPCAVSTQVHTCSISTSAASVSSVPARKRIAVLSARKHT